MTVTRMLIRTVSKKVRTVSSLGGKTRTRIKKTIKERDKI